MVTYATAVGLADGGLGGGEDEDVGGGDELFLDAGGGEVDVVVGVGADGHAAAGTGDPAEGVEVA